MQNDWAVCPVERAWSHDENRKDQKEIGFTPSIPDESPNVVPIGMNLKGQKFLKQFSRRKFEIDSFSSDRLVSIDKACSVSVACSFSRVQGVM